MRSWMVLLFLGFGWPALATENKTNSSVFVPTKEWQVVEKGQAIPAGLHVRHNFETGKTEAKLLEKEDEESKTDSSETRVDETGSKDQTKSLTIRLEEDSEEKKPEEVDKNQSDTVIKMPLNELKAMLKKIKSDEADKLIQEANEQVHSGVQKEFRSYSELKEQLESLNMNVSTDAEILMSLFEQIEPYKDVFTTENIDSKKVEDILDILNDLEYLLHQIDNARLFADLGGMVKIISPALNSTNTDIKSEALRLVGTAVQSNPRVQLKALENDLVQKILYMLTINTKVTIKSRCLFALGALVRHFPAAQRNLINSGGLEIFGKILIDGPTQVQVRVMNLINDLAIERQNLKEIQDKEQRLRRAREYDSADFERKLVSQKYCENLVDLMLRTLRVPSGIEDFHEVVYESMITLSDICKDEIMLKSEMLLLDIHKMLKMYRDYPKMSEDDEDLTAHNQEMLEKLKKILIGESVHDEL